MRNFSARRCVYICMSKDASSSPPELPNVELPNDIAALQAIILQQQATITQLAQTNAEYQQSIEQQAHRIAQLLRQHFGPRREHIDPSQLTLFSKNELDALAKEMSSEPTPHPLIPDAVLPEEDAKQSQKRRKAGHGRNRLPIHLPREQIVYELSGDALKCPCCGDTRCEFSRESSEQLEYIPPHFKVIEHIRVKYVCSSCEENIDIAPKPPQPIERGLPGPGLLAFVVLGKYGDHQPLYRLEDQTARYGFTIRRSTQCGWIASVADLAERLVQRMIERVLQSRVIHTDDTTVQMLAPLLAKTITARFWTYIGDQHNPYTVYDFTESRKRDGPAKFCKRSANSGGELGRFSFAFTAAEGVDGPRMLRMGGKPVVG